MPGHDASERKAEDEEWVHVQREGVRMEPEETIAERRPDEAPLAQQISGGKRRTTRHRRLITLCAVCLFNGGLLALLGWQLMVPVSTPTAPGHSSQSSRSPLLGHPAPDFTLPLLSSHSGPTLHLASLRGKPDFRPSNGVVIPFYSRGNREIP
jgi:hypothetical protein